jgi:hypothetical protein
MISARPFYFATESDCQIELLWELCPDHARKKIRPPWGVHPMDATRRLAQSQGMTIDQRGL